MIVTDEVQKQRILVALSDQYSRRILMATVEQPVSALELSRQYEIPVTTVYRRIEELVEAGLLASVQSGRSKEGKWYDRYRGLLTSINVKFESGDLVIEVRANENLADKFTRMWTSIPKI